MVVLQNAVAPPAKPVAARAIPKPAKKAPAKPAPRPQQQAPKISTSSDENSKPSEGAPSSSSNSGQKNSRKKVVCTLTTVLTARSKVSIQHLSCSFIVSDRFSVVNLCVALANVRTHVALSRKSSSKILTSWMATTSLLWWTMSRTSTSSTRPPRYLLGCYFIFSKYMFE